MSDFIQNHIPESEIKIRRTKLLQIMPFNSAFLLISNPIIARNDDVEFPFRQDSNFWYLSGFDEPDSAILIIKTEKAETLNFFCRPKDLTLETWTGQILGLEKAQEIVKADKISKFSEILLEIPKILKKEKLEKIYFSASLQNYIKLNEKLLEIFDQQKLEILPSENLTQKLRLFKSNWEKEQMQKAANINVLAHNYILENLSNYQFEYQIEADLLHFYKKNGLNWSYPPIVAGGNNATTLHYVKNNQKLNKEDLVLIDSGCEFNYYASDITRTWSLNNKPNSAKKAIFEIVQKANLETIKLAQNFLNTEVTIKDLHSCSLQILSQGLKDLGILKGSLEEILEKKLYQKYYMHGTSHWLGLDVHDQGEYSQNCSNSKGILYQKLEPGMCFTIEPGLYFREEENQNSEFAGIGVRIEDNVFLSKGKAINLSKSNANQTFLAL